MAKKKQDEPAAGAESTDPPADDKGGQTALIDKTQYDREDLAIPKVDGQSIDRISIKFSGEIFLDRSDPGDVKVYNALTLGREVTLLIDAKCNGTGAKGATDRDGALDVVVGTKGIKVHTLRAPAGSEIVVGA